MSRLGSVRAGDSHTLASPFLRMLPLLRSQVPRRGWGVPKHGASGLEELRKRFHDPLADGFGSYGFGCSRRLLARLGEGQTAAWPTVTGGRFSNAADKKTVVSTSR